MMSNPSFRPLRGGQVQSEPTDQSSPKTTESSSPTPTFQRQQTGDAQKKDPIFPEWDLLPPRTIIRRKGQ